MSTSTRPRGRYRLTDMELDFVSLVAAGDDPLATVVISKAEPADKSADGGDGPPTLSGNDPPEENTVATINKSDLAPEVVAYIDGLEEENDTLTTQVEKAEEDGKAKDAEITELRDTLSKSAPKDDESAEEITKALLAKADPAVRSLIEKQQADLAEATRIAKAEREQRLEKEFISKAETLPMLTEDKPTLASLLRHAADQLSPEDNATLDTVLSAANEQIAKGNLFATFGRGGAQTTISKTLRAKAEDLRKEDPSLTIEQAETKIMETDPELAEALMNGEEV